MRLTLRRLGLRLGGVVVAALIGFAVAEGEWPPGIKKAWDGISENAWASALALVLAEVLLINTVWLFWRRQAAPGHIRPSNRLAVLAGVGQLCVLALVVLALVGHIESPGPQAQDLLDEIPERVAHDCELDEKKERESVSPYRAIERAVASVTCTPTGSGASRFWAARFDSGDALDAFFAEWNRFYESPPGTCEGGSGSLPWADKRGIVRGDILCASAGEESGIVWTETAKQTVFGVFTRESADALHAWWTKRIATRGAFPNRAERSLRRLASKVIEASQCTRDDEAQSPLAIASLSCPSPRPAAGTRMRADALFMSRFKSESQLDAHWSALVNLWGLNANENDPEFCDTAPLVKDSWYSGNRLMGRILCFPAAGSQWIAWTLDDRRFYGLVGRNDQSVAKTYRAWQRLADIGQE
jgi:hypothetical protein